MELLGPTIALELWGKSFGDKSVSIYNDNPAAASAIAKKAPKLYRVDMQFLVREIANKAIDNKFYFWGIHRTKDEDPKMGFADALSREFNSNLIKTNNLMDYSAQAIPIVNKYLHLLKKLKPLNDIPDLSFNLRKEFKLLIDLPTLGIEKRSDLVLLKQSVWSIVRKQY